MERVAAGRTRGHASCSSCAPRSSCNDSRTPGSAPIRPMFGPLTPAAFPFRRRLSLRPYQAGCDESIVSLWNAAHAMHAGYIPRTPRLWRWSILQRPGVTHRDILRVEDSDGRLCAYGAIQRDGNVLDFVIAPGLPRGSERRAATMLVEALEQRAHVNGASAITLGLPESLDTSARLLRRLGYRVAEQRSMTLTLLDPRGLIQAILEARERELVPFHDEHILIRVVDDGHASSCACRVAVSWEMHEAAAGSRIAGTRTLSVREPAPDGFKSTLSAEIDHAALTDLVFGRHSLVELSSTDRIISAPPSEDKRILGFLSLLVLRTPWHLPAADIL